MIKLYNLWYLIDYPCPLDKRIFMNEDEMIQSSEVGKNMVVDHETVEDIANYYWVHGHIIRKDREEYKRIWNNIEARTLTIFCHGNI